MVLVPPISVEKDTEHLPGKFVWFDLFTNEIEKSGRFYQEVFNWELRQTEKDNNTVQTVLSNGKPIANLIQRENKPGKSQWLSYMSVKDVREAITSAQNGGATIHTAPKELPDRGTVAIIKDPQNAILAIVHSSSGDPKDEEYYYNSWLGSELWTKDVNNAVNFYQKLAPLDQTKVDVHEKIEYILLYSQDRPRAGIVSIPWDDIEPEWIPYIIVENIREKVELVEKSGGKILIHPDLHDVTGFVAIAAAPTGEIFGIQQVTEGGNYESN